MTYVAMVTGLLIRYPYYALAVLKKEVWWVTWLRYSLWVPLYPFGFGFEGITS